MCTVKLWSVVGIKCTIRERRERGERGEREGERGGEGKKRGMVEGEREYIIIMTHHSYTLKTKCD